LALIFLGAAALAQGEKSIDAKFALTMMGACLLSATVALFYLEPARAGLEITRERDHKEAVELCPV
jgi:hypothetical protein